jgi:hypothetical protein
VATRQAPLPRPSASTWHQPRVNTTRRIPAGRGALAQFLRDRNDSRPAVRARPLPPGGPPPGPGGRWRSGRHPVGLQRAGPPGHRPGIHPGTVKPSLIPLKTARPGAVAP